MTPLPYALLDSGDEQKLERFGQFTLIRPSSVAVWKPKQPALWKKADALFTRDEGNKWVILNKKLPSEWLIELGKLTFKLSPTDFGHLGIFPEHHHLWEWMEDLIEKRKGQVNVLNLFAYSGAATIKMAKCGAKVCHLDASKKSVSWACENAKLNHLESAPIRWIVDDAVKFLQREVKRGSHYDAIILDPPSFGKGAKGEIFKIEKDISQLLDLCRQVLSSSPLFIAFTCHTPGFTPTVMKYLLEEMMGNKGKIEVGEMVIESTQSYALPSGAFARWSSHE
jgi:23S rRNA (cytosine1962-C5)-methyltransferase